MYQETPRAIGEAISLPTTLIDNPFPTAEYIIFCVGQKETTIQQFRNFANFMGLGLKELRGAYKGEEEISFITPASNWHDIVPWTDGQESILLLNAADKLGVRQAALYFLETGETIELGGFHAVSEEQAKRRDAWTYDPSSDEYYVAG